MPTNSSLPWWTWLAPFPVLVSARGLALAFDVPSDLHWFLAMPLGLALALWWGPRILPAAWASALAWSFLNGWPVLASAVAGIPEIAAVGAAWFGFVRVMKGDRQLTNQRDALRFMFGAVFVAAVVLVALRTLSHWTFGFANAETAMVSDVAVFVLALIGFFIVAVPALVMMTPFMIESGWAEGIVRRPRERLLPSEHRSIAEKSALCTLPFLLLLVPLTVPASFQPFANGLIFMGAALHFGFAATVLAAMWMLVTALAVAPWADGSFALPWDPSSGSIEFWLELLLITGAGFHAGRNISDFRYEIGKRADLEWELGRAQATLLAAIEQSQAGIIIADAPDGLIRLANAAAVGMRGNVSDPLIDIPIAQHSQAWQFFQPDGNPWRSEDLPLSRAIRDGRSAGGIDLIIRNAQGDDRWIIANASPIRGLEGTIVGGIAVFTDVTERRKAEEELRRSERRYRTLINASSQGFWLVDQNGLTIDVNDALCRMLKTTRDALIGRGPIDFTDEASRETLLEQIELRRFIDNRTYDMTLVATDGVRIDVRVNATSLRGRRRQFEGSFAFYTDITERKQAERALRESEARFRAFMDNSPAAMYVTDKAGRFVYANERFKDWYGWDDRFNAGVVAALPLSTGGVMHIKERVADVVRERRTVEREISVPRRDGAQRDVAVFEFPVFDADGEVFAIGGINLDVSDIRKTAEALHYRVAFEGLVARLSARFINAPTEHVRHELDNALHEVGDLTRSDYAQLFKFDDITARYAAVARWSRPGMESLGSTAVAVSGGKRPWLDALRNGVVFRLPSDGGERDASLNGEDFADIRALIDVPILRAGVLSGFLRLASRRENPKWSEIDVALLKLLAEILGNTLEREAMEDAFRRAQKMEAVGQIAGGIAHDFNNLLGAIMGFSTFIVEDVEENSSTFAFAQRIQKACERAKYMIQRLLTFSRHSDSERQPVRLADILEEAAGLLAGTIPSTIRLDTRIDVPETRVFADPVQLTQVFMNLCVNARDAIDDDPGEIRIHVQGLPKSAARCRDHWAEQGMEVWAGGGRTNNGELREDRDYVAIDVSDTGKGMAQDVLEQIFEPFFTTKAAHRGTGLGLSVVQGIVAGHNGAIIVRSVVGRGTCFRILLPTTDEAPKAADVAVAAVAEGRTGRVLVIDDDVDFADVVSITLERSGMEVAVATDPELALEVFQEEPLAWDVVLTDHSMPSMTGVELIRRIKELRPEIPCILCTAYAGTRFTPESVVALGISILLEKPVEPSGIVDAVRLCLVELEEVAKPAGSKPA